MSAPILPLFGRLWHNDPKTRIEYSAQLVARLEAAQNAVPAHEEATESEEASATVQGGGLHEDVAYTIKRLVRGLGSDRPGEKRGGAEPSRREEAEMAARMGHGCPPLMCWATRGR